VGSSHRPARANSGGHDPQLNDAATAEPRPDPRFIPLDLHRNFPARDANRTYYVKVTKNGLPLGAFVDEACTERVTEPDVSSAVMRLRFSPALNKGKPVEGKAVVRPTEI